jgi:DNA mismatch endonuclease, patch repair protein
LIGDEEASALSHAHGPPWLSANGHEVEVKAVTDGKLSTLSLAYPQPSSRAVSSVMRANRKVDTRPEVRLRQELHRLGLRFRKHLPIETPGLVVKPDVVFPSHRLAVFVDGCFWHSCPLHGTQPRANTSYWAAKLARNRTRDAQVDEGLSTAGWNVIRIWEHVSAPDAAAAVETAVRGDRA